MISPLRFSDMIKCTTNLSRRLFPQYFRRMTSTSRLIDLVSFPPTFSPYERQALLTSNKFTTFFSRLTGAADEAGASVDKIEVRQIDLFRNKLGFAYLCVHCRDKKGKSVPGIVFLRGDSVSILVIVKSIETGREYLVLTTQARVPACDFARIGLCAGMLDDDAIVQSVAVKELAEELGISAKPRDLKLLHKGLFLSPGGSDERISLYYTELSAHQREIDRISDEVRGASSERERIIAKVIPLDEALRSVASFDDSVIVNSLLLYQSRKAEVGRSDLSVA
jgi:ADP-sugar diphosphatase